MSGPAKVQTAELANPVTSSPAVANFLCHPRVGARPQEVSLTQNQIPRSAQTASAVRREAGPLHVSDVFKSRRVPAEKLHFKAEAFGADVQRGQVDRFELCPVAGGVDQGHLQCGVEVENHLLLLVESRVLNQLLTPLRIVQRGTRSEIVPVFPAFHARHVAHEHVRTRIVRRHRRSVRIAHVEVPTARVAIHVPGTRVPLGIHCPFFGNQVVGLLVGGQSISPTRAAGQQYRTDH